MITMAIAVMWALSLLGLAYSLAETARPIGLTMGNELRRTDNRKRELDQLVVGPNSSANPHFNIRMPDRVTSLPGEIHHTARFTQGSLQEESPETLV